MTPLWSGVAAVLVIAALLWWRSRSRAQVDASGNSLDALDTVTSWEPTATRVLTSQERLAYAVLSRALPEYIVLAQVPLARFLRVPTRNSYNEWMSRVGQICADLVVCDHASEVLAVVDVRQPPQRASERNRKRHDRMGRVLKAAGIPLHVWTEDALPTAEAARLAIVPAKPASATDTAKVGPPPRMAGRTLPTLDDETAGVIPDEIIELGEPPPSTWFDNLESPPPAPPSRRNPGR